MKTPSTFDYMLFFYHCVNFLAANTFNLFIIFRSNNFCIVPTHLPHALALALTFRFPSNRLWLFISVSCFRRGSTSPLVMLLFPLYCYGTLLYEKLQRNGMTIGMITFRTCINQHCDLPARTANAKVCGLGHVEISVGLLHNDGPGFL
jgi:hypothetical protein